MAHGWTRYHAGETIRCPCPPPKDRRPGPHLDRRERLRHACDHGLGIVELGIIEVRPSEAGTSVGTRRRCPRCGGERQERVLSGQRQAVA